MFVAPMAACTLGDLSYPHAHVKRARRAFAATGRQATMRNHQGQGQPVPCQEILVPSGFPPRHCSEEHGEYPLIIVPGNLAQGRVKKQEGGERRERIKKERRERGGELERAETK